VRSYYSQTFTITLFTCFTSISISVLTSRVLPHLPSKTHARRDGVFHGDDGPDHAETPSQHVVHGQVKEVIAGQTLTLQDGKSK